MATVSVTLDNADPLGTLIIDDTMSGFQQIVVSTVFDVGANANVVVVNGIATQIEADLVDAIEVFGGDGNDIVDLSLVANNTFPNLVDGAILINAGTENDSVIGSQLSDIIFGGPGDDKLEGGAGDDSLSGGDGDDTYAFGGTIGLGTDTIEENAAEGIDTLDFSGLLLGGGIDLDLRNTSTSQQVIDEGGEVVALDLTGSPEIENVVGTYWEDSIYGNALQNTLDGGFSDDELFGEGGNDTLFGGWGNDLLEGGVGDDFLHGEEGDDTYRFYGSTDQGADTLFEAIGDGSDTLDFSGLDSGITIDLTSAIPTEISPGRIGLSALNAIEIENVTGTEQVDDITGNALANTLFGLGSDDTIRGGDGNDYLDGGLGDDDLSGEGGDDTINGGGGSDNGVGGEGDDESDDFGPDDTSPPEFEDTPTFRVRKGQYRAVRIVADDLDHDFSELVFTMESNPSPDVFLLIASNGLIDFGSDEPGIYPLEVYVTDPDGLTDTQTITVEVYDYNDEAPELISKVSEWLDDGSSPAPPPSSGYPFGHYNNVGGHRDIFDVELFHPDLVDPDSDEEPDYSSRTLHVQLNPFTPENATNTWYDSQTENQNLTYELISGPGSMDSSGLYEWNVDYTDGPATYKIELEITDDGSPDDGQPRTRQEYFYVKVDVILPVSGSNPVYGVFLEAPVAFDNQVTLDVNEVISSSFYTEANSGSPYIGEYAPLWSNTAPVHGTVILDEENGSYIYTPETDFIGVDTFTYTVEHYAGWPPDDDGFRVTSNPGTITLYVGPRYISDLDTSVADELEITPPGEFIAWNNDDDNNNGKPDYLEINGPVEGENDLVPISLKSFFREDQKLIDYRFELPNGPYFRLWTSADKAVEIPSGTEYVLVDSSLDVVWLEALEPGDGNVYLTIRNSGEFYDPGPAGISQDGVLLTSLTIDLDIDSDNDNDLGLPGRTQWEDDIEDNPYGLGKLVMQSEGNIPDAAAGNTPMILDVPFVNVNGISNLGVFFEFDPYAGAGYISLWTKDKNDAGRIDAGIDSGGDRIYDQDEYTLAQLGIPNGGTLTLYVQGEEENVLIKTLKGVDDFGKPIYPIKVTLVGSVNGGPTSDLRSDEVNYIVAQPDSFFYKLLNDREVRNGLASRQVYDRIDSKQFSLELLTKEKLKDIEVPSNTRTFLSNSPGVDGFNAVLYKDYITGGDHQYLLAFAGTGLEIGDWIADLMNGVGFSNEQYQTAAEIAVELIKVDAIKKGSLFTTGHSLGGGLASAASVVSGIGAHTFNAAGLHPNTLDESLFPRAKAGYYQNQTGALITIDAYYVDWDLLSFAQDQSLIILPGAGLLPPALGRRILKDGPYDAELAGLLALSLVAGPTWLQVLSGAGYLYYMGKCHQMETVMWSLLGEEIVGYEL